MGTLTSPGDGFYSFSAQMDVTELAKNRCLAYYCAKSGKVSINPYRIAMYHLMFEGKNVCALVRHRDTDKNNKKAYTLLQYSEEKNEFLQQLQINEKYSHLSVV